MEKVIGYRVVINESTWELEKVIMDYVKMGYVPQGGIAVKGNYYCQAMVQYQKDTKFPL